MNGDIKIGKLLCDEDIITKRQLNQALQAQIKGDKRALGEILVDKGFCTLEDITDVLMDTADEHSHEDKQEEIRQDFYAAKQEALEDESIHQIMYDLSTKNSPELGGSENRF